MIRPGRTAFLSILLVATGACQPPPEPEPDRPNIVLIVADDLGYGELGSYGQGKIRTPVLDRLAEGGMRFTRHYSGSPVCAPSRATLLTGLHTGHAAVRDNDEMLERGDVWGDTLIEGNHPLPAGTYTIGRMLQDAGYVTAAIGKWGLGGPGDSGEPNEQGFDHWFGYMCQREAHNYYPTHLWRNGERVDLPGNPYFRAHQRLPEDADPHDPGSYRVYAGQTYSMDAMIEEAIAFLREHADEPFFLYLPFPVPHVALQVPDESVAEYVGEFPETPYAGDRGYLPHRTPRAAYAAMISRMDGGIGRILEELEDLGVSENTVVMFTSDNGPTFNGGTDSDFFGSTGGLRGLKTMLYEGGIRVPLIVRWPGRIEPGSVSDHVSAFWDYLPTLAEMTGAEVPAGVPTDGLSMLPVLRGASPGPSREAPLYWEYGGGQALIAGPWKLVRPEPGSDPELYDLEADPEESRDLATERPDVVAELASAMEASRTPSAFFPLDRQAASRLGRVRRACGLVSAAVRRELSAAPASQAEPGGPGAPSPTCQVMLRMDVSAVAPGANPAEAVRTMFREADWTEDASVAADGAGTSSFAWTRQDVRCEVSGGRPASLVAGEIIDDGTVYLDAVCRAAD